MTIIFISVIAITPSEMNQAAPFKTGPVAWLYVSTRYRFVMNLTWPLGDIRCTIPIFQKAKFFNPIVSSVEIVGCVTGCIVFIHFF